MANKQVAELSAAIKELRTGVEATLSIQLEEARQRHLKLSRQLVAILTQLEAFGIQAGACRRDYDKEAQLEQVFSEIEGEIQRIQLGELQYYS